MKFPSVTLHLCLCRACPKIKDQILTDTDSLPPPQILAAELADELETAFDLFTKIAAKLPKLSV